MEINFYKASREDGSVSLEEISVPDVIYERLAKSEFSAIGASKDVSLDIDDEEVNLKLVELTDPIRRYLAMFLRDFLVIIISERLEFGAEVKKEIYRIAFENEKSILDLLSAVENKDYSYIER